MSAKSVTLQLSPEMQAFVDYQVSDGEFADASEYLTHLLRAEQKRKAKKEFERTLLNGLRYHS